MEWTNEERLNLIQALAAMTYQDKLPKRQDQIRDVMQRIMFLCDMSAEFLEANKGNYEDAIKFAGAEFLDWIGRDVTFRD